MASGSHEFQPAPNSAWAPMQHKEPEILPIPDL
jgi:hypothetical protein